MYDAIIYFGDTKGGIENDAYGDPLQIDDRSTPVFAAVRSIGQTEFYQAQTAGMKPECKFIIADCLDYSGQEFLFYNGTRYKILKTYRTDRNELEITCYGGVRDVSA